MSRKLILLSILALLLTPQLASAQYNPLYPGICYTTSTLPTQHQANQLDNRWMGIATSPHNPTQSVFLEALNGGASYSPAVTSTAPNETNFLVKDFTTLPDGYVYAKAYTTPAQNLAHTVEWDPGQGSLATGSIESYTYGGLAGGCAMLRVYNVGLIAGETYKFWITTTQAADDVRMALVWSSSLPDGWVSRADALFEKQADPSGSGVAEYFTATHSGSHGLVVFVNDLTAFGGQVEFHYELQTTSPTYPDLVVQSISPLSATHGQSVTAQITIANQGGGDAVASETQFSKDSVVICGAIPTPAIPAGGSTTVSCALGTVTTGLYSLEAIADVNNAVNTESDEFNNSLTRTLNVTGPALPDLIVVTTTPITVVPNQPAMVSVLVKNQGGQSAAASSTSYSLDGGSVSISIATPALAAGGQTFVSGLLPPIGAGAHSGIATADEAGVITEQYETNNQFPFTLTAQGPNLVIDSISPTTVYGSAAPTFDIVVRNAGNAASVVTYTQLTVDGSIECANIMTPSLAAGASTTVQCASSSSLAPGSHSVKASADIGNIDLESDETDNNLIVTVNVIPTSVRVKADGSGDYATIQAAIDAVAAGGEVLLWPGIYQGAGNRDLNFGGKDLTLVGIGDGEVIIDCQGGPGDAHRGFYFGTNESNAAVVRNITIINGVNEFGAGGAIFIGNSQPTIEDCIIRNSAAHEGGAIAISTSYTAYHPYIIGCTIVGNSANFGAAIFAFDGAAPFIQNTIIANNSGGYGATACDGISHTPRLTISCTNIWGNSAGNWNNCIAGMGTSNFNMEADPLFCDAGANDYSLAYNSPCAERMNADCGQVGARAIGCGNMGGTVRSVNASGTGAYFTIQHAINNSVNGDIVELADGTYSGTGNWDITTLGLAITVRSASGDSSACVIDGQGAHQGFTIVAGETEGTILQGIGIINASGVNGAGILCDGTSPTLRSMYISASNATGDGGGIACLNGASPALTNVRISSCTAGDDGGGLYAATNSSPTLESVDLVSNTATDRGGGACFAVNCFPTINNSRFYSNSAANGGGLVFVYAYGPVTNSIFANNIGTLGGAFYGHGNAQASFTSCTFDGNSAPSGAGVYLRGGSNPSFDKCILSNGLLGAAFDRFDTDCNPTLTCTNIYGNSLGDWTAMISPQFGISGNLWLDPLFCDRLGGNYTLRGDSPCALANNVTCGQIGALSVGCSGSWLVAPDGSGDFATIQEALDAAVAGEEVVLADGVFTGTGNRDLDFKGKAITMRSQSGDASACIIDCEGTQASPHFGINFITGESGTSILQDITIRNAWRYNGGGGRIDAASPIIRRVIFSNNGANSGAGMILANGATPTFEDCVFDGNAADNAGGGLYLNASYPSIVRCVFQNNDAYWGGGGLYNQNSGPGVLECVFVANTSSAWGGAVHNRYALSGPNFTSCVFDANSAPNGGAVYSRESAFPSFMTCTFVNNSSPNGAVLYSGSGAAANLIRNILAYSPQGAAVVGNSSGAISALCCNVYGNVGGDWTGPLAGQLGVDSNFSSEPGFCDYFGGDYTLASNSSCAPSNSPCSLQVGAFGEGCVPTDVPEIPLSGRQSLVLDQNVPNPFNPSTTISFATPADGHVSLVIYDVSGRKVRTLVNEPRLAGEHSVQWNGLDDAGRFVSSGVYFTKLRQGALERHRSMVLLK